MSNPYPLMKRIIPGDPERFIKLIERKMVTPQDVWQFLTKHGAESQFANMGAILVQAFHSLKQKRAETFHREENFFEVFRIP